MGRVPLKEANFGKNTIENLCFKILLHPFQIISHSKNFRELNFSSLTKFI